jgi:chorismate mutase
VKNVDKAEALKILHESRNKIDGIDEEIISLIKKRTSLAGDIVNAKLVLGMDIEDKKREGYIQDKTKKIAEQKQIDENCLKKIMKILTDLSKKEQEEILRRETNG